MFPDQPVVSDHNPAIAGVPAGDNGEVGVADLAQPVLQFPGCPFFRFGGVLVDEDDVLLFDPECIEEVMPTRDADGELLGEPGLS